MSTLRINECLPELEKKVLEEIEAQASTKKFEAQEFVIRQGEYIRFLPIVLHGSIKVFSHEESTQFLLYYITSGDPCIFSFAHIFDFKREPVEFSAITESASELLLLPIHKVHTWLRQYSSFSQMLLKGYQKHYQDLLHTTKQIICYNLEERLLNHLKNKATMEKTNILAISHQNIADDLGTSREVVSRLMKKISADRKVVQIGRKIKVL